MKHKNIYARHLYVNKVLLSLSLGMFMVRCVNKASWVPVHYANKALSLVLSLHKRQKSLCCTAGSNKVYYFCQMKIFSLMTLVYMSSTGRGQRLSLPAKHNLCLQPDSKLSTTFPTCPTETKQPRLPEIYSDSRKYRSEENIDLTPEFLCNPQVVDYYNKRFTNFITKRDTEIKYSLKKE